jgi:hypothetical protein
MKKLVVGALVVAVGLMFMVGAVGAQGQHAGKGMAAVERAAKANRYLLVFFYGDDADQIASMKAVFNRAVGKLSQKPMRIDINITDSAEAAIIDKYGVRDAPLPLVVAIAPNGVVTGSFANPFTEEQIVSSAQIVGTLGIEPNTTQAQTVSLLPSVRPVTWLERLGALPPPLRPAAAPAGPTIKEMPVTSLTGKSSGGCCAKGCGK